MQLVEVDHISSQPLILYVTIISYVSPCHDVNHLFSSSSPSLFFSCPVFTPFCFPLVMFSKIANFLYSHQFSSLLMLHYRCSQCFQRISTAFQKLFIIM